jgi:hypothetical protein
MFLISFYDYDVENPHFTSRWNIDLKKIQVNEDLKDTYILLNYACYNHNTSNFQCEVDLNTILTNHFQMYFYFYDIYF